MRFGISEILCLLFLLIACGLQAHKTNGLEQRVYALEVRIKDLESFAQCSDLYHMQKDSHDWLTITKGGVYVK